MHRLVVGFVVCSMVSLVSASAEEPGDAEAGLQYVRANCAECHEVERHSKIVPDFEAPGFPEIANMSGMTGRALVVALQTSHKKMPNFVLPEKDRNDVVAYIMSLRSSRP